MSALIRIKITRLLFGVPLLALGFGLLIAFTLVSRGSASDGNHPAVPAAAAVLSLSETPAVSDVPTSITAAADRWNEHGLPMGNIQTSQMRLLGSGLGDVGASVYAAPTANDGVCIWFSFADSPGGGGCVSTFSPIPTAGLTRFFDNASETPVPPVVIGVVPNNVTSATVSVDGQQEPASVSKNVLFYEAHAGTPVADVTAVTLNLGGGGSATESFTGASDP